MQPTESSPRQPPDSVSLIEKALAGIASSDPYDIGYPRATDLPLPESLIHALNRPTIVNYGDPYEIGTTIRHHTKDIERTVVDVVADLLGAGPDRWGYVTSGSSEAVAYAIGEARDAYPDVVLYASHAAHPCVAKAARHYQVPMVTIRTDERGVMSVADLSEELSRRRHRAVMVVATLGTPWAEAIDDIDEISQTLDHLAIERARIHVDGAYTGIPLVLLPSGQRPAATFRDAPRVTSWSTSGHKFLASKLACGILVYAQHPNWRHGRIAYTATYDTTLLGSRNGLTPLILWHQLQHVGLEHHRARARTARAIAGHVHQRLQTMHWPAWRNPFSTTVVLRQPPPAVRAKWGLAYQGHWAHLICAQGRYQDVFDEFLSDLHAATVNRDHIDGTTASEQDWPVMRHGHL